MTTPPAMNEPLGDLPIEVKDGDLCTRYIEWGEMAVRYLELPAGTDLGPVLQGLPGDRCVSPHWGVVLEGALHLRHADGSESTTRAGEAYHLAPGHTARVDEATRFVEVGPVAEMRQVSEHVRARVG